MIVEYDAKGRVIEPPGYKQGDDEDIEDALSHQRHMDEIDRHTAEVKQALLEEAHRNNVYYNHLEEHGLRPQTLNADLVAGGPAAFVKPPLAEWTPGTLHTRKPASWLVPGVIPRAGSTFLYAPGNSGKSLVALDLALRLASGEGGNWGPMQPTRVLYAYGEGGSDLFKRYLAWSAGTGLSTKDDHLHFVGLDEPISLAWPPDRPDHRPPDQRRLYDVVQRFAPQLIILDPVQELFFGMDNNDDRSVQMVFHMVRELATFGASTLIVHHARKDKTIYRGATTWHDLSDVVLALDAKGEKGRLLSLTTEKNRYDTRAEERGLTIETVAMTGRYVGETGAYVQASGLGRAAPQSKVVRELWTAMMEQMDAGQSLTWVALTEMVGAEHITRQGMSRLMAARLVTRPKPRAPYQLTPLGERVRAGELELGVAMEPAQLKPEPL